MTTTPALPLLDELDELRAKATPGPWEVRWQCPEESHHHDWDEGWIADPAGATVAVLQERYTSAPADAALIVAAVNRLPELTAALRAVLAKHRPIGGPSHFDGDESDYCDDDGFIWPCSTYRAITTALEAS